MASLWPLHSSSSLGSIRTYTQIPIVYEFGRNFDFVRHNYDLSLQRPTVVSWCCSILSFPEMSSLLKKSLNWSVSSKPGPEKNWAPIKFEATWRWGSRKLRSSRFNFILMAATVFFFKNGLTVVRNFFDESPDFGRQCIFKPGKKFFSWSYGGKNSQTIGQISTRRINQKL